MDIKEKLKKYFGVPDNWDKHDYEIQRYSFNDLLEAVELFKESDSLPFVRDRLNDFLSKQQDIPEDIQKAINEKFWDII